MTIRIIRILVMINLNSTEEIITLMYYSLVRFLNITERLNKRWRLEQSLIQIQYEIMAFYLCVIMKADYFHTAFNQYNRPGPHYYTKTNVSDLKSVKCQAQLKFQFIGIIFNFRN